MAPVGLLYRNQVLKSPIAKQPTFKLSSEWNIKNLQHQEKKHHQIQLKRFNNSVFVQCKNGTKSKSSHLITFL